MGIRRIAELLEASGGEAPNFPPTLIYNEGWLLRLVLDWFSTHPVADHALTFADKARWYSEALLPSPFLPRRRGDPLGESHTHADGVIGQIEMGAKSKGSLALLPDATQFVVLEAKLFSPLSAGVRNNAAYGQAARNVACMAEVLRRAKRPPVDMTRLGFYVVAPQSEIGLAGFTQPMRREAIEAQVAARVLAYGGDKDDWQREWFLPMLPHLALALISWEDLIATVRAADPEAGEALAAFYQKALAYY